MHPDAAPRPGVLASLQRQCFLPVLPVRAATGRWIVLGASPPSVPARPSTRRAMTKTGCHHGWEFHRPLRIPLLACQWKEAGLTGSEPRAEFSHDGLRAISNAANRATRPVRQAKEGANAFSADLTPLDEPINALVCRPIFLHWRPARPAARQRDPGLPASSHPLSPSHHPGSVRPADPGVWYGTLVLSVSLAQVT